MDELANDPQKASQYIQQQYNMQETSDEMLDHIAHLEERHEGMQRIEKSIKELNEMWVELNVLITAQGEMLDNIEQNVQMTRSYVTSGTEQLKKAEKHQKCARKVNTYITQTNKYKKKKITQNKKQGIQKQNHTSDSRIFFWYFCMFLFWTYRIHGCVLKVTQRNSCM